MTWLCNAKSVEWVKPVWSIVALQCHFAISYCNISVLAVPCPGVETGHQRIWYVMMTYLGSMTALAVMISYITRSNGLDLRT